MKRKITEISVYEFFMCMFVITIHLMSEGVEQFTRWSVSSIAFMTITKIITFAVPGFVFTSAIKLFYNYGDRKLNYPKFLLGRLLKIYVPYVIAVLIYYLVFVFVLKLEGYERFDLKQLGNFILTGDISAQFYFVILIVQFYILMPLWVLIGKVKSNIFNIAMIVLSLAATIFSRLYFPQIAASFLSWLESLQLPFGNPMSGYNATERLVEIASYTNKFFTSYLVFWISGMYIGMNYEKFNEVVESAKPVLYIGWLVLTVAHCILSYMKLCGIIRYTYEPVIVVLFCLFAIFGFYIYVNNLTISLENRGKGFLSSIANASYDIYLIHCLVITVVYYYMKQADIDGIMTRFWISAGITYVFSIVFCVIEATIQNNIRMKHRRKSAESARKAARRKRYL